MKKEKVYTWRNISRNAGVLKRYLAPGMTVAVFDTETTGLPSKNYTPKIIQFSGQKVRINGDYSVSAIDGGEINFYINPCEKLSDKITKLTGITQDVVDSAPDENQAFPAIRGWLENADAWAAYNAQFDVDRVREMAARQNTGINRLPVYDILIWARDFVRADFVDNYKLGTIISYIDPDDSFGFHNSDEDVRATVELINHFMPMYISFEPEPGRYPVKLEYAYYYETPEKYLSRKGNPPQQRINLKLAEGEKGDIFYDIRRKTWAAKKNASALRLLHQIQMEDVEMQFLQRYSYPYGCCTLDDAAKRMQKISRERHKNQR
jgi:DNA polymerase III epsilon subunit-like protein